MLLFKIINVFEHLGLERVNPKQDSTFKVLHQPFFLKFKILRIFGYTAVRCESRVLRFWFYALYITVTSHPARPTYKHSIAENV